MPVAQNQEFNIANVDSSLVILLFSCVMNNNNYFKPTFNTNIIIGITVYPALIETLSSGTETDLVSSL